MALVRTLFTPLIVVLLFALPLICSPTSAFAQEHQVLVDHAFAFDAIALPSFPRIEDVAPSEAQRAAFAVDRHAWVRSRRAPVALVRATTRRIHRVQHRPDH